MYRPAGSLARNNFETTKQPVTTMKIVRINTSAYDEEDFYLLTNLTNAQIKKVIKPMVNQERKTDEVFPNEDYFWALKEAHPDQLIELFTDDSIELLTF